MKFLKFIYWVLKSISQTIEQKEKKTEHTRENLIKHRHPILEVQHLINENFRKRTKTREKYSI